jgi:hypothetical protein
MNNYEKKEGWISSVNTAGGFIGIAWKPNDSAQTPFQVSDNLKAKVLPHLAVGDKVEISIDAGGVVRFVKTLEKAGGGGGGRSGGRSPSTNDAILWQTCLKCAVEIVSKKMNTESEIDRQLNQYIVQLANVLYEVSKHKLNTGSLPDWILGE